MQTKWTDDEGTDYELTGESVEEIAAQLPEDYDGPPREDWKAQ